MHAYSPSRSKASVATPPALPEMPSTLPAVRTVFILISPFHSLINVQPSGGERRLKLAKAPHYGRFAAFDFDCLAGLV